MQRLRAVIAERRDQSIASIPRGAVPSQNVRKPESRGSASHIPQPPPQRPTVSTDAKRQRPASGLVGLGGHRRVQAKPAVPLPSLSSSSGNSNNSRPCRNADSGLSSTAAPLGTFTRSEQSNSSSSSGRRISTDAANAQSANALDVGHAGPSALGNSRSRNTDQDNFVSIVDDYSLLLKEDDDALEESALWPMRPASSADGGTSSARVVASPRQPLIPFVRLGADDRSSGVSGSNVNSSSSPLRPIASVGSHRASSDVSFVSESSSTRDVLLESQHGSTVSLDALRSQYFDESKSLDPTSSFFLLELAGQTNVDPLDLMDRSYHRARSMHHGGNTSGKR